MLHKVVLCVGDTTFLDYGIEAKKKVTAQGRERSSIAQCFGYRTAEWSILACYRKTVESGAKGKATTR